MVTTHVFIAVSLDGYIARQDDDIDWLLQRDDPTEDAVRLANQADLMGVEAMSIAWLAAMRRAGANKY